LGLDADRGHRRHRDPGHRRKTIVSYSQLDARGLGAANGHWLWTVSGSFHAAEMADV
jgi:hypothetical protein